ncbi:MAG TPA: glycosyltransferase family 4 protein [Candidatus Paceibacterota bacterium]|nr:glycosyltransferase family 4 protein [Candidatus Paceibacterota bacterium]
MERKLKLLFLTNDFSAGGVQRIIADFANRMHGERFEVEVAVLWDKPGYSFTVDQLRHDVPLTNLGFKKFWDIAGWYRLYRFIRAKRFDIVFTQLFMADLFGRTAAYLARTPVIVTEIQNLIPHLPKKYIVADRVLRHITDLCLSPTAAITHYARDVIGYSAQDVVEVPTNSIDEKRFEAAPDVAAVRASLSVPADAPFIVSVGRLIEQKGHTVLLKAMPLVLKQLPNARAAIVGGGDLHDALLAETKQLGLEDSVTFAGIRKDIPAIMQSADVFAFPSLYEGQGVVLFEAMFSHLPIAASGVGGILDVIKDNETGLLAPPGDPAALAHALVRLLTDASLRARVCEQALLAYGDRTLTHSAAVLGDVLLKVYAQKLTK